MIISFLRKYARNSRTVLAAAGISAAILISTSWVSAEATASDAARLEIDSVSVPEWVETGAELEVLLSARDEDGVGWIDVDFQGQSQRLPAGGQTRAHVTARFTAGDTGQWPLTAIAISENLDARGQPHTAVVVVGSSDVRSNPSNFRTFWPRVTDRRYPKINGLGKYSGKDGMQIQLKKKDVFQLVTPWWMSWWDKDKPQHWDWNGCKPKPQKIDAWGEVLHCWLKEHPKVRNAISWDELDMSTGNVTTIKYDSWSDMRRIELDVAFFYAWEWMHGGLDWFNGEWIQDPPPNLVTFQPGESALTIMGKEDAWRLYRGLIAQSLAVEIGGFVPWSVSNYSTEDLEQIFSSKGIFTAGEHVWSTLGFQQREQIGYMVYSNGIDTIPAPPVDTFQWLVEKDIIRPDQYKTIARLLEWSRGNMSHFGGTDEVKNMEAYWQYAGSTPASRVMELTSYINPVTQQPGDKRAWVAGCWGVTGFFQAVLRQINIPVQNVHAGHSFTTFPTIGSALSHGDDVYGPYWKSNPWYAPHSILISFNTFKSWFYTPQGDWKDDNSNVGRQHYELAIYYPPDKWLPMYCADKANGLSHANGQIYDQYTGTNGYGVPYAYYTVQQLEAKGLWTRLESHADQQGVCLP